MKNRQPEIDGARRGFFRTVAGAGIAAGTGALILRGGVSHAAVPQARSEPPATANYRETDHIRKYYETARD